MQEEKSASYQTISFKDFLRAAWLPVLVMLLLSFAVRMAVVIPSIPAYNDALYRYLATANNILEGNGFSLDQRPPFRPGVGVVPLYPLFIAANYALFGRHELVVKMAQVFLDLFTCVLVAYISFALAPRDLKKKAALSAVFIYGVLSWFTFIWTSYLLTETLAIFLTTLMIALCSIALQRGWRYWFYAGLVCGLAMLTRPDSALLLVAVIIFLLTGAVWQRRWVEVRHALVFGLAVIVALLPWTARNYFSLRMFQPLASEYGFAQTGLMATGYLDWVRTWMTDETYFVAFDPAFAPPGTRYFDVKQLPQSAFDSTEERQRVEALLARYNQTRVLTPDIDEEFHRLAVDRVKRAPVRFFIVLPAVRIASLWLTGFSTSSPRRLLLRMLSVLPILLGGALGFAIWARHQSLGVLLILLILTRTLFMGFHYAPETRYIVEAYPPVIAACGMTAAFIWHYARKVMARSIAKHNPYTYSL